MSKEYIVEVIVYVPYSETTGSIEDKVSNIYPSAICNVEMWEDEEEVVAVQVPVIGGSSYAVEKKVLTKLGRFQTQLKEVREYNRG